MKRITLTICAAAFLFASCSNDKKTDEPIKGEATVASNDSKPKEEPWVAVDSATMMKNWMEYATPGEPHKLLAKSNGTWTGEVTM
jgi:PBP1b-binding outer membrane lipoprotein LpoB